MWGTLPLLWMLIWTASGAPSISVCPENCQCSVLDEGLRAHCSSTDFLSKTKPKQISEITELDISDLNLRIVVPKLRKLKNLKKLDLSKNNIKDLRNFPHLPHLTHLYLSQNRIERFTASDLPKSITNLDLSSNYITNLTDFSLLPNLAEVNLKDNTLSCECDFLKYRDLLLLKDVFIVRPISCYSPENVRGVSVLSVYCAFGKVTYDDWEHMLGDEPGSGEDISAIAAASTSLDVVDFDKGAGEDDKIEEDYFRTNMDSNSSASESDEDSFEGSGSVIFDTRGGSGDGDIVPILPDHHVSHCFYNCSTPSPVEDTNKSAPPAHIGEEIIRFFNEIAGKNEETTITTTTTAATTTAPMKEDKIQQISVATLDVSKEVPVEKATESDKIRAAIEPPTDLQTTANTEKGNTTTYVVVGVLFAAMVVLVAYVVVKKRSKRNNSRRSSSNHDIKEPPPVEMKPLMRAPTPTKPLMVPERTPLMNGQNGTKKSESEEPGHDTTDRKTPVENGIDVPEEEEPQIRPKKEEDALLTPGTKRVTIQAKELSSPKSPVLVHRHVGDDGKIVITPPVSNNEIHT